MPAISRRMHFAQLAALACHSLDQVADPATSADSRATRQCRAQPDPHWFERWRKVQDEEEQRVLSMLRQRIGPDGDLKAAYRAWWDAQNREHTRGLVIMLTNMSKAERRARNSKFD